MEDAQRELRAAWDDLIRELERREVVARIMINPRELEQCLMLTARSEIESFEYNVSHILIGFAPEAPPEVVRDAEHPVWCHRQLLCRHG